MQIRTRRIGSPKQMAIKLRTTNLLSACLHMHTFCTRGSYLTRITCSNITKPHSSESDKDTTSETTTTTLLSPGGDCYMIPKPRLLQEALKGVHCLKDCITPILASKRLLESA